ncbi:hypothetical protein IW261DRAFT_1427045 [Armillaria novae-zelandiae]|uniref:Uncharacterized protein n=1 Tax=Armillaria novae-zelandiae TaxID=153914 RepID=A0AA39NHL3_9AGAR|nr:hypothetical protein IW261DRAFT_1427045 [Armillaria novae-zelandiae]
MSLLDVKFVLAHNAPLIDICDNLIWACTVTAGYFSLTSSMNSTPTRELICMVTKAHQYLDVHMDIILDFTFADLHYGLALHVTVSHLVMHISPNLHHQERNKWLVHVLEESCNDYQLDESLLFPGEDGYKANGDHCMHESDICPSHVVKLPPPHYPTTTPSPIKLITETHVPLPPVPQPQMIHMPEPPKELTFSVPGKKLVGIVLPLAGSALGGPNTCKCQHDQEVVTNAPLPVSNVQDEPAVGPSSSMQPAPNTGCGPAKMRVHKTFRKSPAPQVIKAGHAAKKPVFSPSSESEAPESSDDEGLPGDTVPLFYLSDADLFEAEAAPPPFKHACISSPVHEEPTPSPHAYHHLTVPSEPAPPLPPSMGLSAKAQGKRRQIEPLSSPYASPIHAPTPPFIAPSNIASPSFWPQIDLQFHEPPSCKALERLKLSALPITPTSLSKLPKQTCKGHNLASPALIAHLPAPPTIAFLRASMMTLLDPLTLSSNGAIAHGLACIKSINTQLELLGKVVNQLHADQEQVISELADSLDAIASHEHGIEIIDTYAEVSDFLKSFIVHPKSSGSGDRFDGMGDPGNVADI